MRLRLKNYMAYSIGCAVVWAVTLDAQTPTFRGNVKALFAWSARGVTV
jgi:hypothetical protein